MSQKIVPQQPQAKQINHVHDKHGHKRVDPYQWMVERDTAEVISYLEEENAYYDSCTAHTDLLKDALFEEIKGRIKEDDESVPTLINGYWYYTKMKKGDSYPYYYRREDKNAAMEELLFNVNDMAMGYDFYNLSGMNVSQDNNLVAYGVDTTGRRQYTIYIKNLDTNQVFNQTIALTTGGSVWANDNKTLFFTRKDEKTLRANKIFKYVLGGDAEQSELVYEEHDEIFNCHVYKTMSDQFIMIQSSSTLNDELRFVNANTVDVPFTILQERTQELEYNVSHYQDYFYILTNKDGATNFKVMRTLVTAPQAANWEDVIPHNPASLIEGLDIFEKYMVITDRFNGLNRIHIKSWDDTVDYFLPFDNETYTAHTGGNYQFDTVKLRYQYQSLTMPASVIEFNMDDRSSKILKTQEVTDSNFNSANYTSERLWATASDGVKIPMSVVYRTDCKRDGGNPLLQYGYGSYGHTVDPYFSVARLSLLDRGFIFVIAHIRGGEYLGRSWYETGKMFEKRNSFTDFIAVSEFLIAQRYTTANQLYAAGGSAGGLLMGAVMNMAPHLYKGIMAAVPFVDVVTTMLDDSIPLTTGEYDEWGNPNHKESYDYMLSYSPYDQVTAQSYPSVLVTTGYHDSQVQYWEPAKWVARLRALRIDSNMLLFKTDMKSGHSGASGRYDSLKEVAIEYAFLLDMEGILE
jgi:oligopeptidase B